MARSSSGRLLVDIEPALKRQLYSVLSAEGVTLKAWFVRQAKQHIKEHGQPSLFRAPTSDETNV